MNSTTYATKYGGMYLGAELFRVGDAIRIHGPATTDPTTGQPTSSTQVMVLQEILLVTAANAAAAVHFRGTIYRLGLVHPAQATMVKPSELGPALAVETAFRNNLLGLPDLYQQADPVAAAAAAGKDTVWAWTPLEQGAVRTETDVQGRFYVTHKLMRVLDPQKFTAAVQNREPLPDSQSYLNSRMQSGEGRHGQQRSGRRLALGQAIAVPFVLPDGMVELDATDPGTAPS
jgi:hypothetical protein